MGYLRFTCSVSIFIEGIVAFLNYLAEISDRGTSAMAKCTLVKCNLHLYEISKVVFILASHSRVFQKSFTHNVKSIWKNKLKLRAKNSKKPSSIKKIKKSSMRGHTNTVNLLNYTNIHATERIQWFIEGQAHPLPPFFRHQVVSLYRSSVCRRRRSSLLTGKGRGWAWSQIIRPQEILTLYKSFNTLCLPPTSIGSSLTVRNTPSQLQGWPFPQCQCIDNFRTPWTRRKIY